MASLHTEVGNALSVYFYTNWLTCSVQYPNTTLDTNGLTSFITYIVIPDDSLQNTIIKTANKGERRDYRLVIRIYTRVGLGVASVNTLADYAENLFNRDVTLLTASDYRIDFDVSLPPDERETDKPGWSVYNMSIPFIVWT